MKVPARTHLSTKPWMTEKTKPDVYISSEFLHCVVLVYMCTLLVHVAAVGKPAGVPEDGGAGLDLTM